jgi:hypothetical protein
MSVIKIVDEEKDKVLDKLVGIVDSLDREIDLTWALIGLVEKVCVETRCDDRFGRGLLALANHLVEGLSAVRQRADESAALCFRAVAPRPKFSQAPSEANTSPRQAERPAQTPKFGRF